MAESETIFLLQMPKRMSGSGFAKYVCQNKENSIYTSKNSCLEYNKLGQRMKGKYTNYPFDLCLKIT